jgi:diaminobutyrate-2-oxoglutarate transaminase
MNIFDRLESSVCSYARSFPVTFHKAAGVHLFDNKGRAYLDFLSGAGTLNYGHNHPVLKRALLRYIEHDGIAHGLDMHTSGKEAFLEALYARILAPRQLPYVVQFTGPTGANAVEAALKIARNITGRHNVVAFTNGFHGVSLGAAAATGNALHRNAAGIPLTGVTRALFDGYLGDDVDTLDMLDRLITDRSSGIDLPAAVIVETVQGEGGVNAASFEWLARLETLCRRHEMLLIVDDIQAGCGRTGSFFSFEPAGITPDIVTLSKSLSGYGLPMAVVLLKPEHDQWKPGEHNGTFRGNNHAFVTAGAALEHFWRDDAFEREVQKKGTYLRNGLATIAAKHEGSRVKGRGMMLGIEFASGDLAGKVAANAFTKGLVIETSGAEGQVVKCLCPLVIETSDLDRALAMLSDSADEALGRARPVGLKRVS